MQYGPETASVYDIIYEDMKDYHAEARRVHYIINEYKQSKGSTLLDVACGTGLHDKHLLEWYDVEGVDLSKSQLEVARKRLPNVTFYEDDMTSFQLDKKYDVITCLFSAIGHVTEKTQMEHAVLRMSEHLLPGGILLIEPWIHPDQFIHGKLGVDFVEQEGISVIRVSRSLLEGNIVKLLFDYYVSRDGSYEEPAHEVFELALYTAEEYLEAYQKSGLEIWYDAHGLMGRGLFIGRKPL